MAPTFLTTFAYYCDSSACGSHTQRNLDWEVTALQRNLRRLSEPARRAAVKKRYHDERCGPYKNLHFFVGNTAHPTERRSFSALCTCGPPLHARKGATLDLGI